MSEDQKQADRLSANLLKEEPDIGYSSDEDETNSSKKTYKLMCISVGCCGKRGDSKNKARIRCSRAATTFGILTTGKALLVAAVSYFVAGLITKTGLRIDEGNHCAVPPNGFPGFKSDIRDKAEGVIDKGRQYFWCNANKTDHKNVNNVLRY